MRQLTPATPPPAALPAAISLGALAPLLEPEPAIARLADVPGGDVVAFWYQQRVLRLALHRLSSMDSCTARRIAASATGHADAARHRADALDAAWRDLDAAAAELGIGISGIKGLSMRRLYTPYGPRDLGDLDLMLAGADDAWALTAWLRRRGWDYLSQELPWVKRSPDGRLYGQVGLVNGSGRIDIHYGAYSVRHNALMTVDPPPLGLSVASPAANFGYLLANGAGDHVIRLKELNDVVACLRAADFDWPATRARIREACLEGYWNALADKAAELEHLTGAERDALNAWRFPGVRPERPGLGVPNLRARRRATVRHAWRYTRRRTLRGAVRAAVSAAIYYRMPLRLTVVPAPGLPRPTLLTRATSDRCVRLVPLRLVDPGAPVGLATQGRPVFGSQALRSLADGRRLFALGAGEVFLPTVYLLLCRRAIRHAGATALRCTTPEGSPHATDHVR